ncbi:hypothetical protein GIB67_033415 [Kingdonia uniflora]|uniref:Homeodomain-like superfamily protein n=1 Tax=Kingdonia uniflora TaxID=39325 RepID=A0A7J7LTQ1_9MAGN|nr:hypothetical protein GIB67_033415 [Kingdonia uniflora]
MMPNSNEESAEVGHVDEDEDVDFNPFLRGTPSPEASSSLSSEIEGLSDNVMDNTEEAFADEDANEMSELSRDSEDDEEEVLTQNVVSTPLLETGPGYHEGVVENVNEGELIESGNSSKHVVDLDDEDAICRRTRARYSLANFSLDELENFLQETDDDDDLPNVDDEQEYQKFLTAVLLGGDNGDQTIQETENIDDEDEDNDADFEIEIEEALDSDLEESKRCELGKENYGEESRRPVTRRQKASIKNNKTLLGHAKKPLRPLVPLAPKTHVAPYPYLGWPKLMPEGSLQCPSSTQAGLVNVFTPHQIGQLHCLIHEHVQLLVQVFSLCVSDLSRQHIAHEAQGMMSEMICKRDELKPLRTVPYPDFCFRPPYIHPSVSDEPAPADSRVASPFAKRCDDYIYGRHVDPLQRAESFLWVPHVNGPIMSILDAASLNLVGSYMDDISSAVKDYQQRHMAAMCEYHNERVPLFPLPRSRSLTEGGNGVSRGPTPQGSDIVPPSLPKKTLAATIVESTKKQSVALAPKYIVKLVQRFYPLFNSALFPHKPPLTSVVNRILFTDAEDELLAMGLMEFNTDWKAIQQRYLPCKTKHQIFVRQKNRCSSKAPENSIKAIRRMKTSPLTEEEKARIHEGLRVLKLDWMWIWKSIVPYRDPSLLPRQWRIALGTQKSYKTDPVKREKRRLYESRRRKRKTATLSSSQTAFEKQDFVADDVGEGNRSGDDTMGDEDEAFVHEAFLADWTPKDGRAMSSGQPLSNLGRKDFSQEGSFVHEIPAGSCPQNECMHEFLQNTAHFTHVRYNSSSTVDSHHVQPDWIFKTSKSQVNLRPYKARKKNVAQLVKLSPDLPPVNLPPSVRVISQSAFKSYNGGSSQNTKVSDSGVETEDLVLRLAEKKNPPIYLSNANICPENAKSWMGPPAPKEKSAESEFHMHPLLFQAPTNASTFNFLPANQLNSNFHFCKPPEVGLSAYMSMRSKESLSSSYAVNFHPLLQRTDILDHDSVSRGHLTNVPQDTIPEPNSSYEKENELDLEIHLSSSHKKDRVLENRDVSECNFNGSTINLLERSTIKENQIYHNLPHGSVVSSTQDCASERDPLFGDHTTVLVRRDTNRYTTEDNAGDSSLQEIVMEQEELSDSEEEIDDHVQFECEEMSDSEGEEPDSQHLVNSQHKVFPPATAKKEVIISKDHNHQGELINFCSPIGSKGRRRSLRSGLTIKDRDISKPSNDISKMNDGSAGKSRLSRPSRSCRKTAPNTVPKKPRKRTSRNGFIGKIADNLVGSHPDAPCKLTDVNILYPQLSAGEATQCSVPVHVQEDVVETRLLL